MSFLRGVKDAREDSSSPRLGAVMVPVEQRKNLHQRIEVGPRIGPASKARAKISASHPLRDIDDLPIDFEFQTSQEPVPDRTNNPTLLAKQGV